MLIWLGAKQRLTGQLIGAYFILYGIERGTIEFFRGDPGRTLLFHDRVSLMQIVSVGARSPPARFLWLAAAVALHRDDAAPWRPLVIGASQRPSGASLRWSVGLSSM